MELLTAIVTSGGVSAVVAALFKWLSDTDQSRRDFLNGILAESYKREATVYETLWKEMYALQEAGENFLMTYSMHTDPSGSTLSQGEVKARGEALIKSVADMIRVMDQNRPFFHRNVYIALKSFAEYAQSEQWTRLLYPALWDIKGSLAGKTPPPFDYIQSVDEMKKRIDEVSTQIRARMTAPEEAFLTPWVPLRRSKSG